MSYCLLADAVLSAHLAFIMFAVLGGLLVFWKRWICWVHLPAVLWSIWIEWSGGICPLTPLENRLRLRGGQMAYSESFIERYIAPIIYPAQLTPEIQCLLGVGVLVINMAVYTWVWRKWQD